MNFLEEIFLFIFALLAMLTMNLKYSFGQELNCSEKIIPNFNAKYIFIGEDHRDFKSKKFFEKYAPVFKKNGFDTIFVEYIESKDQHILNKYNEDPVAYRERVFRTYGLPGDWGYDPSAYLYLTDILGLNKIKIHGLDRRSDFPVNLNSKVEMSMRDQHMFNTALSFIQKNSDKKIIFFNGSSHSFKNKKLISPSFYELFLKKFNSNEVLNIKIDYYWNDSISIERQYLSLMSNIPNCGSDFLIFSKPAPSDFDHYLFENTKNFLPDLTIFDTRFI